MATRSTFASLAVEFELEFSWHSSPRPQAQIGATPAVWVEYLTGFTNKGAVVRGNYAVTVVDANTIDLTGTPFGGSDTTVSGLLALMGRRESRVRIREPRRELRCRQHGGKKYRLAARILYPSQKDFVRKCMTHLEYKYK